MSWLRTRALWFSVSPHLLVLLVGLGAATLMTWPLAANASNHVLAAMYHWDAYTNAMIMGGRVDALLGRGPLSLYDDYFFAPLPDTVAFNENLFGLSILFAPFYLFSANPLLSYNLTLLVSLALSTYFTERLVTRLTSNRCAGLLAGVAFACCPYVMFEIGRIQLAATQWVPACFLFLHRAIENRRRSDVALLCAAYVMQVGTCLYYAMFLIPLLALAGGVLLWKHRPPARFYWDLAVGGGVTAATALAMVFPYFASRENFDLERTLSFASSYDGELSFFANVHATNLTLTGLHHQAEFRGAHEEIAFPGFVVLALVGVALLVPLRQTLRTEAPRRLIVTLGRWTLVVGVTIGAALLSHSLGVGLLIGGLATWLQSKSLGTLPFRSERGLYLGLLLLAVLMFLGLEPFSFGGRPVHGLYYYFHTYFPGFNGIRKVSRQAVMTTFVLVVLAAYGSSWLLSAVSHARARWAVFAALIAATLFELRTFPHPIKPVWAGQGVPAAYRFMATLPEADLVATFPQNTGTQQFRGDHGLALHNYLMLYHRHRSLNGQSSWEPPVTNLVNRALALLPDDAARRIVLSVGGRHLLIHGNELDSAHRSLPAQLEAKPEHYQRVFHEGEDYVFSLVGSADPSLSLTQAAPLPANARRVTKDLLSASANVEHSTALRAVDGDPTTFWSTRRVQARGQTFELALAEPRLLTALELENPWNQPHLPLAYEVSVLDSQNTWQTVAEQPLVRVPHDLVYSPKNLVWRVVFPAPLLASRVRISVRQPVSGAPLTIHEAHVYEASAP